ncbi:MAG TPA: rhodanese-like domain-containing protein [Anaeromyxobacteraceae bacterium]|nr:rhodanese-like domain-containing protein [Anaeromyxobacteraceae bacterium]
MKVKPNVEMWLYLAAMVALSHLVVVEGHARVDLERRLAVEPRELYRTLARSRSGLQILDVRPDLAAGYDESHVPGAIPMPSCDEARAPEAARGRILRSVPTVVVSARGDELGVHDCIDRFTSARSLAGGMQAWSEANLPEDSGEYAPPSARAGGGCL